MKNKQKLLRFLIFIVGISIPFNNLAITVGRNFSMGFLSIALYFLGLLPIITKRWRLRSIYGNMIILPLLFLVLLINVNLYYLSEYNTPILNSTMFLCFLMFLALLIHALIDKKALSYCLWGVAFGSILMSILFTFGVGVEIDDDMRLRMFDENSNALGIYVCLGIMIILNDFIIYNKLSIGIYRFFFIAAIFPMIALVFATASRTAFLILSIFVILSILLINNKVGRPIKVLIIAGGLYGCYYAVEKLSDSDLLIVSRLLYTKEEKSLSGRDEIWKSVLPYGLEKPIFGWGETGYTKVTKKVLGLVKYGDGGIVYGYSPHNVFIEVFMYSGIIGLLIMCSFWFLITKRSYILFKKYHVVPPLLYLIPIYACLLSGQLLTAKWAFIIYAYILSEYNNKRINQRKRIVMFSKTNSID